MRRVCTGSQLGSLPAANAAVGTPGYFNNATPGLGVTPTVPGPDWFNILQEEIIAVLTAAGVAPDNTGAATNQLLSAFQTLTRTKINAPLNLYVSPGGSDSNSGTSVASPLATIQAAWNALLAYDLNGYTATINVAAGNYTQSLNAGGQLTGQNGNPIVISGPSGVVWNSAGAGHNTCAALNGAIIRITGGMTLECTAGSGEYGNILVAQNSGHLFVDDVVFGVSAACHMIANFDGLIVVDGSYTVSGAANIHLSAGQGGNITIDGSQGAITITLTGTPAFAGAFAEATACGTLNMNTATFSGAATGARYAVTLNGVINTYGAGASYLPGSSAGTAATGGQYA